MSASPHRPAQPVAEILDRFAVAHLEEHADQLDPARLEPGDDRGIASVQFKLDGSNLGSADTNSPYSTSWNTATADSNRYGADMPGR